MRDVSHVWGQDIVAFTPQGRFVTASGAEAVEQRLIRRLMTVNGFAHWLQDYGAGLPKRVGDPIHVDTLTALVVSQCALESDIQQDPAPVVSVDQRGTDTVFVSISYTYAPTGDERDFSFGLGG